MDPRGARLDAEGMFRPISPKQVQELDPSSTPESRLDPPPRAIVTRAGEQALRQTLADLRHELDVEYAERLKQARAFGEAGGNDDYLQILEEEAILAYRVARLRELLERATVFDDADAGEGVAAIGTTIDVEDLTSREPRQLRLIGDYEPLSADGVSISSPVGQALLGHSAGDEVEIVPPNGRVRRLRIAAVRATGR
jgi:transcription elongation factor GreA